MPAVGPYGGEPQRVPSLGPGSGSPLHAALNAFSLDSQAVELLITRGADPGVADQVGRTPQDCARERLRVIKVEALRLAIERIVALLGMTRAPGG